MPSLSGSWPSWLGVTLPVLVALFAGLDAFRVSQREMAVAPVCVSWDSEASIGIALLVPDSSSTAEIRLDEALYQLRRARKNCRDGNIALAREDYVAIVSAFASADETHRDAASAARRP